MSIADRPRAEIVERLRLAESQLVVTTQRAEAAERKLATAISNEKVYRDALDYCSAPGSFHDTVKGLRLVIERQSQRAIAALEQPCINQIEALAQIEPQQQQLPGEDPHDQPCYCAACVSLRAKAGVNL